jgi:acetyltransferase-like isoleucine patch superfamily enzyme
MARTLKSIIGRLLGRKPKSKFADLINNGNLRIGSNCLINDLSIQSYETKRGFLNVEIGEDSYIQGTIVLHTPNSKVKIGNRVFIGPNTTLFCFDEIVIDDDVMISWGCTLIDTNAHSLKSSERQADVLDWMKGFQYKNWNVVESKPIYIKERCWVGFNSIIMKGVRLGEGSVVAAGSVVTKGTEPFDIIGGNPAAFIKKTE